MNNNSTHIKMSLKKSSDKTTSGIKTPSSIKPFSLSLLMSLQYSPPPLAAVTCISSSASAHSGVVGESCRQPLDADCGDEDEHDDEAAAEAGGGGRALAGRVVPASELRWFGRG